jgi:hypothetical protein
MSRNYGGGTDCAVGHAAAVAGCGGARLLRLKAIVRK